MRADYLESLPAAGILEREELDQRRYRGMNPAFVRRVWAKRRGERAIPTEKVPGKSGPKPKWTAEKKAKIAEMMRAGQSTGQIAKAFGVSRSTITGVVHYDNELREIGFQTTYAKRLRGEPV